ncbi:MAG: c-type cytochrome [Sulfuricurvum sp.]|nr:c-type cytochrome [Sulfuricurvum sp.]
MKSITLVTLMSITLMGADGYKVYKDNCMKCHAEMMTKADVMKSFKSLKAPPMIEVANKIKGNIHIVDEDADIKRRVVIAFIKDYIDNPSIQYSMCDPMALEKFGVMPSLKGKLNEAQKQAVSEWVYDRYEGNTF